ncbi:MAG TPA: DUF1800 family protein [Opitutaceae bacterium]|nr:DUF1800 family protein [Opitutaceae bacterium]
MLSIPAPLRLAAVAAALLAEPGIPGMRAQAAAGGGPLYVALLHPLAGASSSTANGTATIQLSADGSSASVDVFFANLSSEEITAHLTVGGTGGAGTFVFGLGSGQVTNKPWTFAPTGNFATASLQSALASGNLYVEIDTDSFPSGELGGQFLLGTGSQTFTPPPPPPPVDLGVVTQNDAARFLAQATFGPTSADISALMAQGYAKWLAAQLALPETSHLALTRADAAAYPNTGKFAVVQNNRLAAWWTVAATAPDQLRQRVAFALSEIFVVSDAASSLANQPEALANYYDLLAHDAFGNFRQLLEDVTLSPVMGNYLSMLRNAPANPAKGTAADENYAREVMQLFTIGLNELNPDGSLQLDAGGRPVATYDQATIVQTANVFTGWAYASAASKPSFTGSAADWYDPMMLYPAFHDNTPKTIVNGVVLPAGQGGAADLKEELDTLFNHQNTAPFFCRLLIQRLVTSDPSPGYVYRVAQVFANDGSGVRGDLAAVVRAILLDPEARSPSELANAGFGKLKEPLLRQAALYRAFHAASAEGRFAVFNTDSSLGQTPLASPTVFNFFLPNYIQPGLLASADLYAPEFEITTASTAISVVNSLHSAIYTSSSPSAATLVLDLSALTGQASSPPAMVALANLLLCGGNMSASTQRQILSGLAALPASAQPLDKARFVLELAAVSPDGAVQQ